MNLVQELKKALGNPPFHELYTFYNSLTEFEKMVLRRSKNITKTVREIQTSRMSMGELLNKFLTEC